MIAFCDSPKDSAKGGDLLLGGPGHEPAVLLMNVELSVCQERLSNVKSRLGPWRALVRERIPALSVGFKLSRCIRSKVGGCRCPCQGHVSSGARSENNENLRITVSLRCRDVVPGIQNPNRLVLPFVHVVSLGVVVAVVVCSIETYEWNLIASRIHIPWK